MKLANNTIKTASLVAVLLFLMASCKSSQVPVVSTTTEKDVRDTEKVVVYRDTTIYIQLPAESHKTVSESNDTSHLSTSLAISEAWTANGKLFHTLVNKAARQEVTLPKAVKTEIQKEIIYQTKTERVEVPIEVNRLTWWQSLWIKVGRLSVGLWLLILLFTNVNGGVVSFILKFFK